MEIEFYKRNVETNLEGVEVYMWKFKDMNGNIFVTETPIDGTEEDAASIILGSMQSA